MSSLNDRIIDELTINKETKYRKLKLLGEGTSGKVYLAEVINSNKIVAIKVIKPGDYGIDGSALREIKLLNELNQHDYENIIHLYDVYTFHEQLNLVYEYCITNLNTVIYDSRIHLSPSDIKQILYDCLEALNCCHKHYILHRDIKPDNVLISPDFKHKLTDFGLSTFYGTPRLKYSSRVCTSPYKPPELCLKAHFYSSAVDIWSMGMLFAEILLHGRLIQNTSDNDYEILSYIFHIFGTPTEAIWPGFTLLDGYFDELDKDILVPIDLKKIFVNVDSLLIDLLSKMFIYDPNQRITAEQALEHPYFKSEPLPTPSNLLPYSIYLNNSS